MNTVKLISEEIQDVEYITEEKENGKKNYKIKGILCVLRYKEPKWSYISTRSFRKRSVGTTKTKSITIC